MSSSLSFTNKNYFRTTMRVPISLGPDQARRFVGPDLGQTVCKGYRQTTLVGKELTYTSLNCSLQDCSIIHK